MRAVVAGRSEKDHRRASPRHEALAEHDLSAASARNLLCFEFKESLSKTKNSTQSSMPR